MPLAFSGVLLKVTVIVQTGNQDRASRYLPGFDAAEKHYHLGRFRQPALMTRQLFLFLFLLLSDDCLMRWCHGSSCFNTLSIVAHNPTWWTVTQPVHCLLCLSLRYVGVPGSVILLCMVVGSYAMVGIHLHRQIWHCVLFMSFLFQIYGFDLPGTWHNLALHCLFFAMHRLVLSGTVLLLPCTGQMEALVSLAFKASILHVPVTYARDIA